MQHSVDKSELWEGCTLRIQNGVIELRENHIGVAIFYAALLLGVPCGLAIVYYVNYGYIDWIVGAICVFAAMVMASIIRAHGVAPRAVRLYPAVKLAQTSRFMLGMHFYKELHELKQADLVVQPFVIELDLWNEEDTEDKAEVSRLKNTLKDFADLIAGPNIFPLLTGKGKKKLVTRYGLVIELPNKLLVLAVLDKKQDGVRVVDAYHQHCAI